MAPPARGSDQLLPQRGSPPSQLSFQHVENSQQKFLQQRSDGRCTYSGARKTKRSPAGSGGPTDAMRTTSSEDKKLRVAPQEEKARIQESLLWIQKGAERTRQLLRRLSLPRGAPEKHDGFGRELAAMLQTTSAARLSQMLEESLGSQLEVENKLIALLKAKSAEVPPTQEIVVATVPKVRRAPTRFFIGDEDAPLTLEEIYEAPLTQVLNLSQKASLYNKMPRCVEGPRIEQPQRTTEVGRENVIQEKTVTVPPKVENQVENQEVAQRTVEVPQIEKGQKFVDVPATRQAETIDEMEDQSEEWAAFWRLCTMKDKQPQLQPPQDEAHPANPEVGKIVEVPVQTKVRRTLEVPQTQQAQRFVDVSVTRQVEQLVEDPKVEVVDEIQDVVGQLEVPRIQKTQGLVDESVTRQLEQIVEVPIEAHPAKPARWADLIEESEEIQDGLWLQKVPQIGRAALSSDDAQVVAPDAPT